MLSFFMPDISETVLNMEDVIRKEDSKELIKTNPERIARVKDPHRAIIERRLPYLASMIEIGKKEHFSLALVLGGDSPSSDNKKGTISLGPIHQGKFEYKESIDFLNGFSKPTNTGVDINYLIKNYPNNRWKFYLSLACKTPEQEQKANLFLTELAKRCTEKKISLLTKTEDHGYDNPDIYTWQPITMAGILKDLYQDPKFSGIWADVLHPFQRPIPGMSIKHIGLVQEPIFGLNGKTHSDRMIKLANRLTELAHGQEINPKSQLMFVSACSSIGIDPAEPWRMYDKNLRKNNAEIYQREGIRVGII